MADRGARPARVAILINDPYVTDSRAWKIASSLGRAGYDVTVVAPEGDGLPAEEQRDDHRVVRVARPAGMTRSSASAAQAFRYLAASRAWAQTIEKVVKNIDVWQAESVITLPLAVAIRRHKGGVIVYDANDVGTEAGRSGRLPRFWGSMLRARERAWVRTANALVTVSEPYAEVLTRSFGRRVDAIVRNGPADYEPLDPSEHVSWEHQADVLMGIYAKLGFPPPGACAGTPSQS